MILHLVTLPSPQMLIFSRKYHFLYPKHRIEINQKFNSRENLSPFFQVYGCRFLMTKSRSHPRFGSTVVLEMCCTKEKTTTSLWLQISNDKILQSSSVWLNCCFRDALCQREDDNEFIVPDFYSGRISQLYTQSNLKLPIIKGVATSQGLLLSGSRYLPGVATFLGSLLSGSCYFPGMLLSGAATFREHYSPWSLLSGSHYFPWSLLSGVLTIIETIHTALTYTSQLSRK